ncbi:MAG: hypothetical protein GY757_49385 [bacterium]|nr:hypothetical protein [bacterium]
MRRIDKKTILSTCYKEWVDKLDRDQELHPDRDECGKYYLDVLMNLLYCQKGVCAYTEMRLCRPEDIDEKVWKNGRYKKKKADMIGVPDHSEPDKKKKQSWSWQKGKNKRKKPDEIASLDHFDPDDKEKQYWKWGNLFAMHDYFNSKKSTRKVEDKRFKPDLQDYDPFKLLEYDFKNHYFLPHRNIEDWNERDRIMETLDILQINNGFVRYERETYFQQIFADNKVNRSFQPDRFYTAFEMWKDKIVNPTGEGFRNEEL